jgi:hypothetical protein
MPQQLEIVFMKRSIHAIVLLALLGYAGHAEGHGFSLSVNYNSNFTDPLSLTAASQSAFLDQQEFTPGPSNLFLEAFSSTPNSNANGTFYSVIHGFAQTAGPWLPYTASFNVISPLFFSSGIGTGPGGTAPFAVPAVPGTYIDVWDLWAGNPEPTVSPHPGASFGDVYVNGSTSFYPGFGVSLYDTHELEKDLYIGSGPANGEYGFAFDVVVHFSDGITLTSSPLVDVFAISDPNYGDFADNASVALQDKATMAIYDAVTAVPEPSSVVMLAIGAAGLTVHGLRRHRRCKIRIVDSTLVEIPPGLTR